MGDLGCPRSLKGAKKGKGKKDKKRERNEKRKKREKKEGQEREKIERYINMMRGSPFKRKGAPGGKKTTGAPNRGGIRVIFLVYGAEVFAIFNFRLFFSECPPPLVCCTMTYFTNLGFNI